MVKKSDIVREAVRKQDWKKALQIAKDFHIGVTQEQRSKMARAYECIVHPDFYRQIGVDILEAIEQGKAVVKEYVENTRRANIMKWDIKHDKAKKVIDAALDQAEMWFTDKEKISGLTEDEIGEVNKELILMITSIRKRYKLQERLSEQQAVQSEKKEQELVSMPVVERLAELKGECTRKETEEPAEKLKGGRKKASAADKSGTKEKKPPTRKSLTKKTGKEVKKDE